MRYRLLLALSTHCWRQNGVPFNERVETRNETNLFHLFSPARVCTSVRMALELFVETRRIRGSFGKCSKYEKSAENERRTTEKIIGARDSCRRTVFFPCVRFRWPLQEKRPIELVYSLSSSSAGNRIDLQPAGNLRTERLPDKYFATDETK